MKHLAYLFTLTVLLTLVGCRPTATDFVYIDGDHFALNGEPWFPLMLNYKAECYRSGDSVVIAPAIYYLDTTEAECEPTQRVQNHLAMMQQLGFNCVRVCLDVMNHNEQGYHYSYGAKSAYITRDSSAIYQAVSRLLHSAERCQMKVMLLLKPPMNEELVDFTKGLLRHCANTPTLFAYDFMNEPLYFDNEFNHSKSEAYQRVCLWRKMMNHYAPHQLFTIAFAEPIEVFEWDASLLPVDFVEIHTYHPMRVSSEMYWYGHYCGKPWMVGETSLPADGDSVPYSWQSTFMEESFQCALNNGACGYGWWEFQDCIKYGANFEAQYAGLYYHSGKVCREKEAAAVVKHLTSKVPQKATQPVNYYNMLGYTNLVVCGKVIDKQSGKPIEGAVIRGWNKDWSVGMSTYTYPDGTFTLYSNDACSYFEISAPKYSDISINYTPAYYTSLGDSVDIQLLPHREREYQAIHYADYMVSDSSLLHLRSEGWNQAIGHAEIKEITLKRVSR